MYTSKLCQNVNVFILRMCDLESVSPFIQYIQIKITEHVFEKYALHERLSDKIREGSA